MKEMRLHGNDACSTLSIAHKDNLFHVQTGRAEFQGCELDIEKVSDGKLMLYIYAFGDKWRLIGQVSEGEAWGIAGYFGLWITYFEQR